MVANDVLVIMLLAPIIGAIAILLINNKVDLENKNSSYVTLWTSGFVLLLSIMLYFEEGISSSFYISHYAENFADFAFSFNKYFELNSISAIFITLTSFVIFISSVTSLNENHHNRKVHSMLVLLLESIIIALFSTTNIIIFYVCYEAILIPMFLIIGLNNNNFRVGRKFLICLLFGSLVLLGGIIYILSLTGVTNISSLASYYFSDKQAIILFTILFIGLALKSGLFPFHIWLPDAHTLAPTSASMLLSGVFLKVGCYGFLVLLLKILPRACNEYSFVIYFCSTCGVIYGSVLAYMQKDFKRMVAYTSIVHISLITMGIFSMNSSGISGAIFQMLSHGITVCGLFFIAHFFKYKVPSNASGISSFFPMFSIGAFIIFLSGISFPLTSNFIGSLSILSSIFYTHTVSSMLVIFAEFFCVYYLFGKFKDKFFGIPDSDLSNTLEKVDYIILYVLSISVVIVGLFSHYVISYITPNIKLFL